MPCDVVPAEVDSCRVWGTYKLVGFFQLALDMASSQSVLMCPMLKSLRWVMMQMLVDTVESLSSRCYGARMIISMWTKIHKRGLVMCSRWAHLMWR